jgi:biopolymer transport protein ExbD
MNVFIIIIPFLLLTAVFAKTSMIEIFLAQQDAVASAKSKNQVEGFLTVKVTSRGFVLKGIGKGIYIKKKKGKLDYKKLSMMLVKLKDRHPRVLEVAILLSPTMAYESVVKVMDATRETIVVKDGKKTRRVLFPLVSLGENR